MNRSTASCLAMATILASVPCLGDPIVLSDVPAYNWYHGCGPTAAASILGYWDVHGYPNLFDSSGNDVFLTANVTDEISSPAHNAKYDPTPDNSNLPDPTDTSIADFFHTSEGSLGFGWSYQSYADAAFTGYGAYRGYHIASSYEYFYSGFSWSEFTEEIDAGRPMMFLVDTAGKGSTDHFVPAIGYDDRGSDGMWYGIYTTWSESEAVVWEPFVGIQPGTQWGIGYATFVRPLDPPVPEGATIPEPEAVVLLATAVGLLGAVCRRRLARRS